MVYEKSILGFNEFTAEKRTLGVRDRQVLLLVNGVRKLEDLENFSNVTTCWTPSKNSRRMAIFKHSKPVPAS